MNGRAHRRAFTLVEMIVVVAIIGILTAIAIPTLRQMGLFGRDPIHVASRQVLTMLKAARIYAGTHRVDTAVVYSVNVKHDNVANVDVTVIDGAAIVRRLTPAEQAVYAAVVQQMHNDGQLSTAQEALYNSNPASLLGSETPSLAPFVPVKEREGTFQRFPQQAVIAAQNPNSSLGNILDPSGGWPQKAGFCPIRLLNSELQPVDPRSFNSVVLEYPQESPANGLLLFPANVFKPSGVLQTASSAEINRFRIMVIPAPDADHDVRYVKDASNNDVLVTPGVIDIFGATGRVESES